MMSFLGRQVYCSTLYYSISSFDQVSSEEFWFLTVSVVRKNSEKKPCKLFTNTIDSFPYISNIFLRLWDNQ